MKQAWVYILASQKNGTLYIGVTSNLIKRIAEHKAEVTGGFTKEYTIKLLVYFEPHDSMEQAILREKQMKKWNRLWKLKLIEKSNAGWVDLYPALF